jgi:circadian clock protein KaiC
VFPCPPSFHGFFNISSISSFEMGIQDKVKYTDFIYTLINYLKAKGVTTYLTHEIHESVNILEFTKFGISFIADNMILLQEKESCFNIKKYLRIVMARACSHELGLREFKIIDQSVLLHDIVDIFKG